MANQFEEIFTNIADAIRDKTETTDKMKPSEMADKISNISSGGNLQDYFNLMGLNYNGKYFKNCSTMTTEELTKLLNNVSTSNIRNFSEMFYGCSALITIPYIDTSNIVPMSGVGSSMESMFYNCSNLISIPDLVTKNNTSFSYTFYGCEKLESITMNVSNARYIDYMFSGCNSIKSINLTFGSPISNIIYAFQNCSNLEELTLTNISTASGGTCITDCSRVFAGCLKLKSVPYFDTSNVTVAYSMFSSCSSLISIPEYDFSKCVYIPDGSGGLTPFLYTFAACSNLEEIHCKHFKRSFDISASTKFTESALVEILNNLDDVTEVTGGVILTMGSTNLAKLTDEEKAIATNKGWTLA